MFSALFRLISIVRGEVWVRLRQLRSRLRLLPRLRSHLKRWQRWRRRLIRAREIRGNCCPEVAFCVGRTKKIDVRPSVRPFSVTLQKSQICGKVLIGTVTIKKNFTKLFVLTLRCGNILSPNFQGVKSVLRKVFWRSHIVKNPPWLGEPWTVPKIRNLKTGKSAFRKTQHKWNCYLSFVWGK